MWKGHTRRSGLLVVDPREIQQVSNHDAREMKAHRARPGLLKRRPVERLLHLPDGTRLAVRVDEAGNSHHVYDEHQDAVARPETLRLTLTNPNPNPRRRS